MIPVERAHLYLAAITHPGRKGKKNEDRYSVSAFHLGPKVAIPSLLAVVSDGVGGHRAGEVAAEMAVETINRVVARSDGSNPLATLREAIQKASEVIYAQSLANPSHYGMSTTCACALVIGDRLYTASVGDSRIYLLRNHSITQLTTDHTWVQEVLEAGVLTPEEARNHPNAHVIRRHLGSQELVEPDFRLRLSPNENDAQAIANQGMKLCVGDRLILCSDGLTDLVNDQEILEAFSRFKLNEALNWLVQLANTRGGHDNITIIALQVPPKSISLFPEQPIPKRMKWLPWALLGSGLLLIAGLLLMKGWFGTWDETRPTPNLSPTPLQLILSNPTAQPTLSPTALNTPSKPPRSRYIATYTPWPTSTPLPATSLPTYSPPP